MSKSTISIFGLGHVGLTFAVCLAHRGFQIIGYDIDEEKLQCIMSGKAPFYEANLDELLAAVIRMKRIQLTNNPQDAVSNSSITFVTVDTPIKPNGSVDLSSLAKALQAIGQGLRRKNNWHLVVIRSTVPPGTCLKVIKVLEEYSGKRAGADFGLCFNPEFLREGNAIEDIMNPDRIVIGEYDSMSGEALEEFYKQFHGEKLPLIIRTSLTNAEIIKYANNAFLAMKISFINMIANLCEKLPGADITEVAKGIGLDRRIGLSFLNAGVGWGGSCFLKDLKALIYVAKENGLDLPLVEATISINDEQPLKLIELARKLLGTLENKRIAILGLAFKPGTDDMRNAPSIKIINKLLDEKARVVVYDPRALHNARKIFGDKIEYAVSSIQCIQGADCALIVTEWPEFKELKPEHFIKNMRTPCVIDGRRIYDPKEFEGKIKFAAIGLNQLKHE
ncbi:MAG: UDP-glucose/GDP-mannose dehydrogenase family protein [Nitrososphaerota archaeon]